MERIAEYPARSSGAETHERYISATFYITLLMLCAGIVLAIMVGGFSASFAGDLSGVPLAFLVGSIVALIIAVIILIAGFLAFRAIHSDNEFEKQRLQRDQEALLAERTPQLQPWVVQESPILYSNTGARKSDDTPRTINDVPEQAFDYFVHQLCRGVPHTQRTWDKATSAIPTLPGGYEVTSFDAYDKLIAPLVAIGAITGRAGKEGGNKPGTLVIRDPGLIMAKLREFEAKRPR